MNSQGREPLERARQTQLSHGGATLYSDTSLRVLSPLQGFGFRSGRYQGLTPLAIICRSFGAKSLSDYMAPLASLAVRLLAGLSG